MTFLITAYPDSDKKFKLMPEAVKEFSHSMLDIEDMKRKLVENMAKAAEVAKQKDEESKEILYD